jgi:recombinational DNA repair ATPase RecF
MIPMSTPRGPIYFETGLLDIEHTILKNRINYANKLGKKNNNVLQDIIKAKETNTWLTDTTTEMKNLGVENKGRRKVKEKILHKLKQRLETEAIGKSKTEYYLKNAQEITTGK